MGTGGHPGGNLKFGDPNDLSRLSPILLLPPPPPLLPVLTPATAMGIPLIERLRDAGMVFEITSSPSSSSSSSSSSSNEL